MELKDFVVQSLIEISQAVHEANEAYKKYRGKPDNAFLLRPGIEKSGGTGIHFNLAVTTKIESGTAGKAGVNIRVVDLSTGGESQQAKESISRIDFSVSVANFVG